MVKPLKQNRTAPFTPIFLREARALAEVHNQVPEIRTNKLKRLTRHGLAARVSTRVDGQDWGLFTHVKKLVDTGLNLQEDAIQQRADSDECLTRNLKFIEDALEGVDLGNWTRTTFEVKSLVRVQSKRWVHIGHVLLNDAMTQGAKHGITIEPDVSLTSGYYDVREAYEKSWTGQCSNPTSLVRDLEKN
jgi:hypothetical protein